MQIKSALTKISQELRCSICYNILTNPQTTQCQHTFCYNCIIRCNNTCPICKHKLTKRAIRSDNGLNEIILKFIKLREVYEEIFSVDLSQYQSQSKVREDISEEEFSESEEEVKENLLTPFKENGNLKMRISPSMSTQQIAEFILQKKQIEKEIEKLDCSKRLRETEDFDNFDRRKSVRFNNNKENTLDLVDTQVAQRIVFSDALEEQENLEADLEKEIEKEIKIEEKIEIKNKEIEIKQENVAICVTSFSEENLEMAKETCKSLNMKFQTELNNQTTHLIVQCDNGYDKLAPRTLKYFKALSKGLNVLDVLWLLDCKKDSKILPSEGYEIKGDAENGITNAPLLSRTNKIFAKAVFFIVGDFDTAATKGDVENLIVSCGGICKKRFIYKEVDFVLVGSECSVSDLKNYKDKFKGKEKSVTWLFDCISLCKVIK